MDDYDIRAEVVAPEDGSVTVSSEKVAENSLSTLDGFDSRSGGFDFAVAFEGDSAYVVVNLTVRRKLLPLGCYGGGGDGSGLRFRLLLVF